MNDIIQSKKLSSLKVEIHELVEVGDTNDWFDHCIFTLVILNVIAVILETVPSIHSKYSYGFHIFELISISIFSIEYLLRLWSCTFVDKYNHPIWGRLRFAAKPLLIIDLISILPFFLTFIGADLRHLRVLRIVRLLRAFKLVRYSKSMQRIGAILKTKAPELISGLILIWMMLIISSSIIYFVEHEAQPKVFSSIPATMWWGIVTLTTVGYGDMYPITVLGKVFAGITAICGIGLFALPAGVLGAAFLEDLKHKEETQKCSHCNKILN